jgi:hypothetical protein
MHKEMILLQMIDFRYIRADDIHTKKTRVPVPNEPRAPRKI